MESTEVADSATDVAESLSRARAGDGAAFCRLVEPLQTRLLRQAAAMSGDVNVAEDLVSETLVEAWKSIGRYDESCRFSTWLYAILLHRCQKWKRRARSRPLSLAWLSIFQREESVARQQEQTSPELSPADGAAQTEHATFIRDFVNNLPEKQRAVILLRFYEDASLPDIARVLKCPLGTVKSRLHHALEALREMDLKMNLSETGGDKQI